MLKTYEFLAFLYFILLWKTLLKYGTISSDIPPAIRFLKELFPFMENSFLYAADAVEYI